MRQPLDVDEVLFDSAQLQKKQLRWEHRLEAFTPSLPMRVLLWAVLAVILFFAGRSFWLGVPNGQEFRALADQNHIKEEWQRPPRGIIYSNDLQPLVGNTSTFNLVIIPAEISRERKKQEELISFLKAVAGKDRTEVASFLGSLERFSFRPVPYLTDLARDEVLALEGKIKSVAGVRLEENLKRKYPDGSYFAHLIGYTGLVSPEELRAKPSYLLTDIIGKNGVEQAHESVLRGTYGKKETEISSLGSEERVLSATQPQAGQNVVLFLDSQLQKRLTDVMQTKLNELGLRRGAAVAIDPRSGGIIALQSFPLYDNNIFSSRLSQDKYQELFDSKDKPLFNRAVGGLYPPGSTIKPFIATAGLEEKVITAQTTVNVTGSITVAGQEFVEFGRRAHGILDLKHAIALSSNVYFYVVGGGYGEREGLGPYRIKNYLSRFGFGSRLGLNLAGEQDGLVPDPDWKRGAKGERWYVGDTYNISIGQGDMIVTPLQMAAATAAVANGGVLLRPRVVRGIGGQNLQALTLTEPEIIRKEIAAKESLNLVKEGMRELVLSGSARMLQDLPVAAAGKTGTAQFGQEGRTHAWFTVFAPYENPEIVLTVLVEGTQEGSLVAVPIAREILKWYFSR